MRHLEVENLTTQFYSTRAPYAHFTTLPLDVSKEEGKWIRELEKHRGNTDWRQQNAIYRNSSYNNNSNSAVELENEEETKINILCF